MRVKSTKIPEKYFISDVSAISPLSYRALNFQKSKIVDKSVGAFGHMIQDPHGVKI